MLPPLLCRFSFSANVSVPACACFLIVAVLAPLLLLVLCWCPCCCKFFLLNRKSANSQAHFAIANPQISELCQSHIANSQICNDESANHKSSNFLGVPTRKSQIRKFARKKQKNSVSDLDPHWFASKNFKSIFQTTKCHVTLSQNCLKRQKSRPKFE